MSVFPVPETSAFTQLLTKATGLTLLLVFLRPHPITSALVLAVREDVTLEEMG